MSTRAAVATSSRRVKQNLVRLLYGPLYSGQGRDAHRLVDHVIYSYADLRSAYLVRIQQLHPDRHHSVSQRERDDAKKQFVELQDAWQTYDGVAKTMKRVDRGDVESSFTMFGVGCSFSDNEEERALRTEITDQACRGWFSSGSLDDGSSALMREQGPTGGISLLNEHEFIEDEFIEDEFIKDEFIKDEFIEDEFIEDSYFASRQKSDRNTVTDSLNETTNRERPSLVAHLILKSPIR